MSTLSGRRHPVILSYRYSCSVIVLYNRQFYLLCQYEEEHPTPKLSCICVGFYKKRNNKKIKNERNARKAFRFKSQAGLPGLSRELRGMLPQINTRFGLNTLPTALFMSTIFVTHSDIITYYFEIAFYASLYCSEGKFYLLTITRCDTFSATSTFTNQW